MNDQPTRLSASEAAAQSPAPVPVGRERDLMELAASGLVDAAWYGQAYNDPPEIDPVAHFLDHGAREGRLPNPYFATEWYLRQNPDVGMGGHNPLLHYIRRGEAECRAPAPHFDLAWYRTRHAAPAGQTLLCHFLNQRRSGRVSPLPEFDPAFYLSTYPDIAAAGIDPFEHFLNWGYREGRNPSSGFDTRWYVRRYLDGDLSENPLLHYRRIRRLLRVHPTPPASETGVFDAVRAHARPGPDFEEVQPLPASARRRAMVLAFYLPQFHAIAENDAWWGAGFTEWSSIQRAMPRFEGHFQPRMPRDLGHYTLAGTETLRRQVALARGAGLSGFVNYFYWFNGRRLLEAPLEAMLADPGVDFPFCLMWANENWTRRWDGGEHEVLIAQDYRAADDEALVDCLARHFRDTRYIRLEGRPVLMVYRPALIPDTAATVARWRRLFHARHGENPLLVMAQSFDAMDPRVFGFDAAVEFPPHKLVNGLPMRNPELTWFDSSATAQVFAYEDVVAASLGEAAPGFPLIKTAVPSWDNDARRQGAGLVLHGAHPAKYQAWLGALVERARGAPVGGAALVCVNAWNEWAEAAYLEPDVHFGGAWLNATARAIAGLGGAAAPGLLLVGHDAFAAGAQMLLLHLARQLRRAHGVRVEILLLGGGALREEYAAVAPTVVLENPAAWPAHLAGVAARGFGAAIVNTAVAGAVVPALAAAGMRATLLVHELPRLLREKAAEGAARAGAGADSVVFPSPVVEAAFAEVAAVPEAARRVLPQGNYREVGFDPAARARVRAELGVQEGQVLVLGAGYGDLRKGFDLFLQVWRGVARRRAGVVFAWIGALDPAVEAWLGPEIAAAVAGGVVLPGFRADAADWFSAADLFCLSSREDPFPTVALEAMAAGLRVVGFAGAGGIAPLLDDPARGAAVPIGDAPAMAEAVAALLATSPHPPARAAAAVRAQAEFHFPRYAARLLAEAMPGVARISAVVPNYNHEAHLAERLASVFAQTHPVAEVLLLDDASTDGSLAVARRVAGEWGRELRILANRQNSGSVFAQWRRGVERAVGDWVWLAESDDAADPALLATLAARAEAAPEMVAIACDSRAVDAAGAELWPSHQAYFAEAGAGAGALARDGVFEAKAFAAQFLAERNLWVNASAILFRRTALLAALERCGPALAEYRMAGDWHLYLDLLAHAGGHVAWVAAPLNTHRRHGASVTGSLDAARHLDEIARAQAQARAVLGDAADAGRQAAYLTQVREALRPVAAPAGPAVGPPVGRPARRRRRGGADGQD